MGTAAHDGGISPTIKQGDNGFSCKVDPMILTPGKYFIRAAIFNFDHLFDHIDEVMTFEIEGVANDINLIPKGHYVGDVYLPYKWCRHQHLNRARH
jgi:hypothetical protein